MIRSSVMVIVMMMATMPSVGGELAERADAYLESKVAEHGLPALSAGILVDGEILWTGAAGFADVERRTPATAESIFRIASISKVLTAVAVLRLADQGSIDLDAPVQHYLPDFPEPRKGTMRVIHLLEHTSGIRHSKGDESRLILEHYDALRDACRFFEARKTASVPGTKYRYSSYGFTALGAVLESATDSDFGSLMREQVWEPAGMKRTGLDRRPAGGRGTAKLYKREGDRLAPDLENDLSLIYPGGGMVSTAEDLLRLVIALDDGTLLSAESVKRMLQHPTYNGKVLDEHGGIGWNVWNHEQHGVILSRIGGQSGSSALIVSYRDRGVTAVLLSNLARLDPIWEITNELIGMGLDARKRRNEE